MLFFRTFRFLIYVGSVVLNNSVLAARRLPIGRCRQPLPLGKAVSLTLRMQNRSISRLQQTLLPLFLILVIFQTLPIHTFGRWFNLFATCDKNCLVDLLQEVIVNKFAWKILNSVQREQLLFKLLWLVTISRRSLIFTETETGVKLLASFCFNNEERAGQLQLVSFSGFD